MWIITYFITYVKLFLFVTYFKIFFLFSHTVSDSAAVQSRTPALASAGSHLSAELERANPPPLWQLIPP